MSEPPKPIIVVPAEPTAQDQLHAESKKKYGIYFRFVLAVLSSVPWVGGLIGAAGALSGELGQNRVNDLQRAWLDEHEARLQALQQTIAEISTRIETMGEEAKARAQTEEYLGLVRHAFRAWDRAPTEDKRRLVQQLLSNAAGSNISSDDVVRMFISWIERYDDIHFRVMRHVYQHKGATRGQIWRAVGGTRPREDSAEADLFRLLIRDLSTGGVIRQRRETDYSGNFVKKSSKRAPSGTLTSAFDSDEQYELTELGSQFVHYTMNEVVPRMGR